VIVAAFVVMAVVVPGFTIALLLGGGAYAVGYILTSDNEPSDDWDL
jgi:hypothetical protein